MWHFNIFLIYEDPVSIQVPVTLLILYAFAFLRYSFMKILRPSVNNRDIFRDFTNPLQSV